jgi:hypothetical protein
MVDESLIKLGQVWDFASQKRKIYWCMSLISNADWNPPTSHISRFVSQDFLSIANGIVDSSLPCHHQSQLKYFMLTMATHLKYPSLIYDSWSMLILLLWFHALFRPQLHDTGLFICFNEETGGTLAPFNFEIVGFDPHIRLMTLVWKHS